MWPKFVSLKGRKQYLWIKKPILSTIETQIRILVLKGRRESGDKNDN